MYIKLLFDIQWIQLYRIFFTYGILEMVSDLKNVNVINCFYSRHLYYSSLNKHLY